VSTQKRTPIRFGVVTALVWLLVAGGIIFLLWQVITRISANDILVSTTTPDQTQVAQTIETIVNAQATGTAIVATLTASSSPTSLQTLTTSTPVPSPKTTPTPGQVTQTSTPESLCDQAGAGNPIDVTIPDDTVIPAGQSFVKTWKLVNIGTCTWTTNYSATFFYGDRMGAPESVPLKGNVSPSQNVEISIEMVAPQNPGTYQGNWKLANPDGDLFGIGPNGSNPFWVRIVVEQNQATPTSTPTLSVTSIPTETPTATVTPPGQVGGELSVTPGDTIDLDTITLNSGNEDLTYVADENGYHWLSPQSGALLGVYGNTEPSLASCQAAVMSPAPIAVESLPVGTYLCYATNQGRFGRALLVTLNPENFTLTLDLLTWALP
jgi:Ig-like domain from next to BRCA1 gene